MRLYSNNPKAQLASGISDSVLSLTVKTGEGALFPAISGAPDHFMVTLVDLANNIEIVKVTARSSDVLTIVRAQEGTAARAYVVDDRVELRQTAAGFNGTMLQGLTRNSVVAAGTSDALTAVFAEATDSSLDDMMVFFVATPLANATTTPNINVTLGSAASGVKDIVKGNNQALSIGDIPGAGYLCIFMYDSSLDKWVLINPALLHTHTHDGADSSLIEVGPNTIRNPSFEEGLLHWTFNDYTGGSHAIDTSNDMHGAQSLAITSTSTTNGGGQATETKFTPVAGDGYYPWYVHYKGSVANVSSRIELVWYTDAQVLISATQIVNETNTPTASTQSSGVTQAPATARFVRMRVTGGVPTVGSATGTIYFDGLRLGDFATNKSQILAEAVGQNELDTDAGEVSSATAAANVTPPGGEWAFLARHRHTGGGTGYVWGGDSGQSGTATGTNALRMIIGNSGGGTTYCRTRYVQASPPYDLGNGDVPLFLFAAMDAGGTLIAGYAAPDPPWAFEGPTNIKPDFYRGGVGYQRKRMFAGKQLDTSMRRFRNPIERAKLFSEMDSAMWEDVEVTQAVKQADMGVIPHPFADVSGMTQPVLLDPMGSMMPKLNELLQAGDSPLEILEGGYLIIDNIAQIGIAAPPGVMPVGLKWKNT